ncbi:hypothetical protein V6R21_23170 [Limibacter armeniacum]|uniref:hypothetical protein n=1 Tax=Limibacter armeniacum TaxID=466084 RepID=UPI002FE5745B
MIRVVLALLLTVVIGFSVEAQDLYVLHVKGDIRVNPENKPLKTGDKITADKEIKFMSQDATAIVMSREKGRMQLDGKKSKSSGSGEFLAVVTEVMVPMKLNMQMSTRSEAEFVPVRNLKEYFGEDQFAVVGEQLFVPLDESQFPEEKHSALVFRYEVDGKPKMKVLPRKQNIILFNKDKIFGNHQPVQGEIYHVDKVTKASEQLTSFRPVFINEDSLSKELNALADFYTTQDSTLTQDSLRTRMEQYVQDVYGKTDAYQLGKWIEKQPFPAQENVQE